MGFRLLIGFILLFLLIGFCQAALKELHADHNPGGKLPLVPNTPAIRALEATGELTFCFGSRAKSYPGFVDQARNVLATHETRIGVKWVQVPRGPDCQVVHTMPDTFPCSDWAWACVTYHLDPVVVYYNYRIGATNWQTTQSHETGHIYGMHEAYVDTEPVSCHFPTRGTWAFPWSAPTIMDCGTGVYRLTEADRAVMGQWLSFGWEEPEPRWNGSRWVMPDGWRFNPSVSTCCSEAQWETPDAIPAWSACTSWDGRKHLVSGVYIHGGTPLFHSAHGWATAPEC